MGTTTVVLDRVYEDAGTLRWSRFLGLVAKGRVGVAEVAVWPMLVASFEEVDVASFYGPESIAPEPLLAAKLVLRYGAFEFISFNGHASGDSKHAQIESLRAVVGGLAVECLTAGGGLLKRISPTENALHVSFSSGLEFAIRPRVPDDAWSITIEDY